MIKKLISISFLLLYLAFLILPAFPLMHYYFFSSNSSLPLVTQQKTFSNGDHAKTGDMAYLSALMKSATDNSTNKKAQNPPPVSNNEVNNLIYLVSGNPHLSVLVSGIPLHFQNFTESVLDRYQQVLIPPPDLQA